MSKKLEEKQRRREAEERKRAEEKRAARRRNLVTIGLAVAVMAGVVALVMNDRKVDEGPVGVAGEEAGCTDIETFEPQEAAHIDPGTPHDPYNSDPPTSGPHYAAPADPAFYPDPLPPEQLVHNLEHGMIVIWYAEDASDDMLEEIERLVDDEPLATVAVPYGVEPPHRLVLTAWGASQSCEQVSEEVVNDFRRRFQGKGPEQGPGFAPPFEG